MASVTDTRPNVSVGAGNGSPGNAVKMVRSPTFFVCLGKAFYGDLGTSTGVNCFQTASKLRHPLQYLILIISSARRLDTVVV